jgi:hypothetical protein
MAESSLGSHFLFLELYLLGFPPDLEYIRLNRLD